MIGMAFSRSRPGPVVAKWLLAGGVILAATNIGDAAAQQPSRSEAELAKLLEGRIPGAPVHCISLSNARSSRIVDRTAVVYTVGGTLYVNRPRSGAESLDSDDILITRSFGGSLCRLDTVRLVDRASRSFRGVIALDDFVPYKRTKSDRR